MTDLRERFWSKVRRGAAEECWPWIARLDPDGYGRFGMHRPDGAWSAVLAHRAAWQLTHNTELASGIFVCHKCDNPCCVNPAHLFVGNYYDNMSDMIQKGRVRSGERCSFAKLTEAQVKTIRAKRARGAANKDLAKEFGVDASTISIIVTGKRWKGVA